MCIVAEKWLKDEVQVIGHCLSLKEKHEVYILTQYEVASCKKQIFLTYLQPQSCVS